jgi:hypothetical protein
VKPPSVGIFSTLADSCKIVFRGGVSLSMERTKVGKKAAEMLISLDNARW